MIIGIISDTHDRRGNIEKAIDILNGEKAELVVHCGDWVVASTFAAFRDLRAPIIGVLGNMDLEIETYRFRLEHEFKEMAKKIKLSHPFLETEQDGKKIAACHGHDASLLEDLVISGSYDVVCCGHTHTPKLEQYEGRTLVINPGTVAGYYGFERKEVPATIALYDTKTNEAKFFELPQYDLRGASVT